MNEVTKETVRLIYDYIHEDFRKEAALNLIREFYNTYEDCSIAATEGYLLAIQLMEDFLKGLLEEE